MANVEDQNDINFEKDFKKQVPLNLNHPNTLNSEYSQMPVVCRVAKTHMTPHIKHFPPKSPVIGAFLAVYTHIHTKLRVQSDTRHL